MARFDLYQNPGGGGLLLDVQAGLLDELNTRVVVPLIPISIFPKPAQRLNPVFEIGGERLVMVTQYIAAVPLKELRPKLTSLADRQDEIVRAIDVLLSGI